MRNEEVNRLARKKQTNNLTEWIKACIVEFAGTAENTLMNTENEPAWGKPLVGFSSGNDLLWEEFKRHIGPFYWTPSEIFAKTFPSAKTASDELTVISWILPQTRHTKSDHRKEKTYPSERWARSRKYGEEFNVKLRIHVVDTLMDAGYKATAPVLSPLWEMKVSERYGLSSTWSERHAAFVSGLGTFGLCDGLITPAGKAIRCGSVIAHLLVPASPRPYQDHHAYCLFFSKGTCRKCIDRCPVGAITEEGHDKHRCQNYVDSKMRDYIKTHFGFDAYGCGLCQTGVPCESRIPVKPRDKA
jgi:epoxyqueuosine reductase